MELQLLKQLKKNIQRGLTQLPLMKFNVIIIQSKQLSKLKKPSCLFSAQSALEVLFSVSGTQLYQKMQQFESLTFQFEFKKERIFKAKKHLLNYLSEKQQNEGISESMAQSIINYVALIENLVAFAEVHYKSVQNFSNLMQNEMNKNQLKQQEIKSINDHLSKLTKTQKEIKETVLQLPLEDIKHPQYQPIISENSLIKEDIQDNESETEILQQFTKEQPNVQSIQLQQNQQINILEKQQQHVVELQVNIFQNAVEITSKSLEDTNLQQITQPPQQLKESVLIDQLENLQVSNQESEVMINKSVESLESPKQNQDDKIKDDLPDKEISLMNSDSEQNNEAILDLDQNNSLPVQVNLIDEKKKSDQKIIQDILQFSPLESLDTLPKNQFVQTSLSPNKVSIKMAVLQNLVNESLFMKSKPEVDCFQEKLQQNAIQDLIERPIHQGRSRTTKPFNQDQESLKKGLFDIK